jgi:hypothetical protein
LSRGSKLLLAICALVGVVMCALVVAVVVLATQLNAVQTEQQKGRKLAIGVTCAAVSAISNQGRRTISNAMPLPPGVEALLEAHGFPSFEARRAQAQIAGAEYVQGISAAIEQQVGQVGDGLVNRDGTLNCDRLTRVAKAR